MLLPKIALPWASPVLLLSLLLPQEMMFANSGSFDDTIYLNRRGEEIKRVPAPNSNTTFIIRTTQTTEDLYPKINSERGISNPISSSEADKAEMLIKTGRFAEALRTGNLIELSPLAERRADAALMLYDNGRGGERPGNNREYASVMYRDGNRIEILGEVANPRDGGADIRVPCPETAKRYSHSHASGIKTVGDSTYHFYPQAPSMTDIHAASPGQLNIVFGRDTNLVYIYDSSGVLAVMPTKVYMHL